MIWETLWRISFIRRESSKTDFIPGWWHSIINPPRYRVFSRWSNVRWLRVGIMQWSLPVVGDFMNYQSPIGNPNLWGDHKATVVTIRNPVMIWDVPLATVVEVKEGELHYQRSDTRCQPACFFVFCLGCFEIWDEEDCFWQKSGKRVILKELAPFLDMTWLASEKVELIQGFGFHSPIPSTATASPCGLRKPSRLPLRRMLPSWAIPKRPGVEKVGVTKHIMRMWQCDHFFTRVRHNRNKRTHKGGYLPIPQYHLLV